MKAIYYHRSLTDHNAYYDDQCWFVPEEEVIICKTRGKSFRTSAEYTTRDELILITNEDPLNTAKAIAQGSLPNIEGITFSNVEEIEYNRVFLRDLISNLRTLKELELKVDQGYKNLSKLVVVSQHP